MAEVIHRYVRDPLSEAEKAERQEAAQRKAEEKRATTRLAQRGAATLRRERAAHERTKRLEREMLIAIWRGELIERAWVVRQAAFLLTALRGRCMSAPSAWSRRLLNISDSRVMLSLACRRALRRPTEIINQDINADQEHPQREDQ